MSHKEVHKWYYLLVLVSAFTLVGLNQLPPEQMLLIEEDTLWFDRGKGPKFYPEKRPICRRLSTDALIERPKATGSRNRHLLDFHQSPFSRVAALIQLGAWPIRLGCLTNLPGTDVPDGIALVLPVATARPRWGGVGLWDRKWYLFKSECNSTSGAWTRILQYCSPTG